MGVDVHGVFTPIEGRPLEWKISWSAGDANGRKGELAVTGADMALRIALEFDPAGDRLRWRVAEGHVNLGAWLVALAVHPEFSASLAGLTATGELKITGAGEWENGAPTGELSAEWRDGTVANASQGWAVDGVTLKAGGDARDIFEGTVPVELAVRTLVTSRFGARNLAVRMAVKDMARLEVKSTEIEIAGGRVTAEPFAVSLAAPALDVTLAMERVGLQDLVVFVPTTLSYANGRINGRVHLGWSQSDGLRVGEGELEIDKGEPTTLRLVSNPGFLTKKVPARFTYSPFNWDPLVRLFSSPNDSYETLSLIETGKLALRVDSLEAKLTPEGDGLGRSASVLIHARPEQDGSAVGTVIFQINVSGPLASVLRVGMKQSFSVKTR
jgi:hypothetical protein